MAIVNWSGNGPHRGNWDADRTYCVVAEIVGVQSNGTTPICNLSGACIERLRGAPTAAAKGVKWRKLDIYILRRDGLRVPRAEDDKSQKNFQNFLKSACNAFDNYSMEVRSDPF